MVLKGFDTMPGQTESFRYDVKDSISTLNAYMDRIKEYALSSIGNPYVLEAARKIVVGCRPYDVGCEVKRAFQFVKSRVRYSPAPARYGVEVLQTPEKMLHDINAFGRTSGECEEMVILLTSILANLNIPVAMVYGGEWWTDDKGKRHPNYRHVWMAAKVPDVKTNKGWVHLDPTAYADMKPGQHFRFEVYGWEFLQDV